RFRSCDRCFNRRRQGRNGGRLHIFGSGWCSGGNGLIRRDRRRLRCRGWLFTRARARRFHSSDRARRRWRFGLRRARLCRCDRRARDWARLNRRARIRLRGHYRRGHFRSRRRTAPYRRGLNPTQIVKRIGEHIVERGRINLLGRRDPIVRLRRVVMFELPRRLRVIERRRVAGELELLHHLLRAAIFVLEQERQINFVFDELRRLIFIAAGRLREQLLETIARLRVILFLKRQLREIVLRLAKLVVDLECLSERRFRLVELLLLHHALGTEIQRRRLVRLGRIGFVDEFARR